jgi:hypothetical protein
VLCVILSIRRGSYYKWLSRRETKEERLNHELSQIIWEYHHEFKGILGYRRMTMWVNTRNQTHFNVKRIRYIHTADCLDQHESDDLVHGNAIQHDFPDVAVVCHDWCCCDCNPVDLYHRGETHIPENY